ncbi:DUF2169 family type VI secretion system accessory protein [Gallaecimonas mangrovi]|uniref:DUF2169 family type VI secretion system accessory protein n=1 Tax=Gallaecimonas mangrovi TaxID=2291597 RepID=UPI000E1FFEE7|nr:DUF2169 domain-containing protein [Gallaecimonas mangrovi]
MKAIKPLTLGLLTRPYRQAGQNRLCIAALGFFKLGEHSPRFLDEAPSWPKVLNQLPATTALDEVYPKPHGEFLVAAQAYAPGGKAVTELSVTASLGSVSKTLAVVGDRNWYYDPWYRINAPTPFRQMPLDLSRAYGGKRLAENPLGTGHTGNPLAGWVGQNEGKMPNLQYPDAPIHGHVLAQSVASFDALDPSWPQRRRYAGTYNEQWLLNDAPGLAADLNTLFFQRSAQDQWQQGPWQGGEAYRLENLHPQHPVLVGNLPHFKARAFARQKADQQLIEAAMALDTVWLMPSINMGVMVYHGFVPCQEPLASDLDLAMVAYETPAQPKSVKHYQQVATLRADVKTAAQHILNESQLAPALAASVLAERQQKRQAAAQQALSKQQAVLDEIDQEVWAKSGLNKPADYQGPKAQPSALDIDIEALKEGEQQLSEVLAQVDAIRNDAKAKAAALKQQQTEKEQDLPKPTPPTAEELYQKRLAQAATPAWDLVGGENPDHSKLKKMLQDAAASGQDSAPSPEDIASIAQQLTRQAAMQRQVNRVKVASDMAPLSPEHAQRLGTQVRQWLQGGISLKGRDLSGADLTGYCFDGLDLQEVNFEQANLSGCRFIGANLSGAVFLASNITDTDFTKAQLAEANFSQARASNSRFVAANLASIIAMHSDFSGGDFSGANLSHSLCNNSRFDHANFQAVIADKAQFNQIQAAASQWQESQLDSCLFYKAALSGANFSNAKLHQCVLLDATLDSSVLCHSQLSRSLFTGASAKALDGRHLRAKDCGFGQVNWQQANLACAYLAKCDLANGDFQQACLDGAILTGALLSAAKLMQVSAVNSNFLGALAQEACFDNSNLTGACFLKAFLSGARFHHCQQQNAQFDPATLRQIVHQRRAS